METQHFKIVIPVHNAERYVGGCIDSVLSQSYSNWEGIILNDDSTDGTLDVIKSKLHDNKKFTIVSREKNLGALANMAYGINKICTDDEDIIINLDGDDMLYNSEVLSVLNQIYTADKNLLLTYGQYMSMSNGMVRNSSRPLTNTETYRKHQEWCTTHLRTYKYFLWRHIKDEDLRYTDGEYFRMGCDLALMYPMIEMAGVNRIKCNPMPLCIYNDVNSWNCNKRDVGLQHRMAEYIKEQPTYNILESK